MHQSNVFKLSIITAALASALAAFAAEPMHDHAGTQLKKVDDGLKEKTTNVYVRNWDEPKPVAAAKTAAYEGAALEAPAKPAQPDIKIPPLPAAKPGECYARVWNDPTYETRMEQRVMQPAGERIDVIPARYEKAMEKVMVKEASKEYQVIPAEYETVSERVLVRAAYTKTVAIPATYDTFTEQVLVRPAYTTWKPGDNGGVTKVDEATGEVMCLVEVPAEYKTVTKQVLRTPASTKTIEMPAEYENVEKRVLKTPARTVVKEIPAQYEMREVTKLVEPAREVRVPVAAVYDQVPVQTLVADGSYEWRSVLCEANATPAKITEIQSALKAKGFYNGPLDGKLSEETLSAAQDFEKANGLPVDRHLNIETVTALGVSPR